MKGVYLNFLCQSQRWGQVRDYLLGDKEQEEKKAAIEWKDKYGFSFGLSSLHCACYYIAPVDIIKRMIDIAGDDIVFVMDDERGCTPLHYACYDCVANIDVIEFLINTGGKRLVMMQNVVGNTALHEACLNLGVVKLLKRKGEPEHTWLKSDVDVRVDLLQIVVKLLVEKGGLELTRLKNNDGETASEINKGNNRQEIQDILDTFSNGFYEKFDNIRTLAASQENQQIISIMPNLNNAYEEMDDFLQFKLLLTAVNAFHRLQIISNQDRMDLIHKMLVKAKKWCTSPFNTAMYRVIIEYLRKDNLLTTFQQFSLEQAAIETQISNADFIKEMQSVIANNTRHINNMEHVQVAVVENLQHLSQSINDVHRNVEMVHKGVSKFVDAYQKKERVKAGCAFLGAILNVFSFGFGGSAIEGVMGMAMANIVDFSYLGSMEEIASSISESTFGLIDEDMVTSVASSVGEMTLKESFDMGLKLASTNFEDRLISEAVKHHNAIALISASAAIFSFKVDEDSNVFSINDQESCSNNGPDPTDHLMHFNEDNDDNDDNVFSINPQDIGSNNVPDPSPSSSAPLVTTIADRIMQLELQVGISNHSSDDILKTRLDTLEARVIGKVQQEGIPLIRRIEQLEKNILGH